MSDFVFFELSEDVRRELRFPPHPIPVRRANQGQVFLRGGQVNFLVMLDEVRVFLDENPELEDDYRQVVAMLSYLSGMDAAARGFHDQALRIYERGLDATPESVSLRSHYALSLHCLRRDVEARREIEEVIAGTPKDRILPILWMILARIYAHDGEYEKAYWLLQDVSTLIPEEDGFWDFLGEMAERAGIHVEPQRPATRDEPVFTVDIGPAPGAAFPASPGPAAPPPSHGPRPHETASRPSYAASPYAAPAPPAPPAPPSPPAPPAPPLPPWPPVRANDPVASPQSPVPPVPDEVPVLAPEPESGVWAHPQPAPQASSCVKCGTPLAVGAKFCLRCGAPAAPAAPAAPPSPPARPFAPPAPPPPPPRPTPLPPAPSPPPSPPASFPGPACATCRVTLTPGAKFCLSCGTRVATAPAAPAAPQATPQCRTCGQELLPGVKFCALCGAKAG